MGKIVIEKFLTLLKWIFVRETILLKKLKYIVVHNILTTYAVIF